MSLRRVLGALLVYKLRRMPRYREYSHHPIVPLVVFNLDLLLLVKSHFLGTRILTYDLAFLLFYLLDKDGPLSDQLLCPY